MQADEIRSLFEYHMALNRRLWDECIVPLTDEQFLQPLDYSVGSIRNQMVHMPNVDSNWFELFAGDFDSKPNFLNPVYFSTREKVRTYWDEVEATMHAVLADLTDEFVNQIVPLEMRTGTVNVPMWKLMLHVVNHGTDHRAQVLAMLHSLGAPTFAQDMVFHFLR